MIGWPPSLQTISGNPAASTILEQTLLGIVSPSIVTIGRPAHKASPAEVCAL